MNHPKHLQALYVLIFKGKQLGKDDDKSKFLC